MKKTRITSKFKLISPKDKKRIRGGCHFNNGNGNGNGNGNNGGIPPYQPGGQGDNDKDDD